MTYSGNACIIGYMKDYYQRYADKEIERKLKTSGAILVEGPKFCGKTTTCMRYQKSFIKLNTKDVIALARLDAESALEGEAPRLIDEWQTVPDIWNQVKNNLDSDYQFGKFILTGSATPVSENDIFHSGAGRITPVTMRTMSLYESKESTGEISLKSLFDGQEFLTQKNDNFTLDDVIFLMRRGGWPISVLADNSISLEVTKNYCSSLFMFENSENGTFRNKRPELMRSILKSLARNISTPVSHTTIINDLTDHTIDPKTYADYYDALKDLFIIEELPAWSPNIRSKTAIRTTPVRHFVDTSIACSALSIAAEDFKKDLHTFGLFFEDFALRDLSIYIRANGGNVKYYRDNAGLECDAILTLENGDWGAAEIKLGGEDLIEKGANSLKLFRQKIIEKSSEKPPKFLMVVTAFGPAYRREDGVFVVPINLLRD